MWIKQSVQSRDKRYNISIGYKIEQVWNWEEKTMKWKITCDMVERFTIYQKNCSVPPRDQNRSGEKTVTPNAQQWSRIKGREMRFLKRTQENTRWIVFYNTTDGWAMGHQIAIRMWAFGIEDRQDKDMGDKMWQGRENVQYTKKTVFQSKKISKEIKKWRKKQKSYW